MKSTISIHLPTKVNSEGCEIRFILERIYAKEFSNFPNIKSCLSFFLFLILNYC
jgi:hypothetical protein